MPSHADHTIQRLADLKDMATSNEVKVLAKIMSDYVEGEKKADMGFKTELDKKEEKPADAKS